MPESRPAVSLVRLGTMQRESRRCVTYFLYRLPLVYPGGFVVGGASVWWWCLVSWCVQRCCSDLMMAGTADAALLPPSFSVVAES